MKVKSIKPIDRPHEKGFFTKIAKSIIKRFLETEHQNAEINVEEETKGELLSTYNAMKSYLRRSNLKINCSVDVRKKKLYLSKVKE